MKFGLYFVVFGLSPALFSTVTQAWTTDDRGEEDSAKYFVVHFISAEAERPQSARGRTFLTNCESSLYK